MTLEELKYEWSKTKSQLTEAKDNGEFKNDKTKKHLTEHTINVISMFLEDLEKIE